MKNNKNKYKNKYNIIIIYKSKNLKVINLKPVAVWIEKERVDEEIANCLTIILRSKGCYWKRCLMCGYKRDTSEKVTLNDLIDQFKFALKKLNNAKVVKIFTSGSFFDQNEIPLEFRKFVYTNLTNLNIRKLIVESRPEFITEEVAEELSSLSFDVEVSIGLETSNDYIREYCINKGFKFEDFKRAAKMLKAWDIKVKAYLLLKPPFLSEKEAIEDALKSIRDVKGLVDRVSLNPMNIQSGTYVEKLWEMGLYRPPWLWSVVEVLKNSEIEIISDPVAAGKSRGPHNCGRCDKKVESAIRKFSLTQDDRILELDCKCLKLWEKVIELEDYARIPLALIHI